MVVGGGGRGEGRGGGGADVKTAHITLTMLTSLMSPSLGSLQTPRLPQNCGRGGGGGEGGGGGGSDD